MSRDIFGHAVRRGSDQLRHPDFGFVIGRLVCADCGNRELAHVRRYADATMHLLTEDIGSAKLFAERRFADGQRRPVPWLDVDLDEIRPDASLLCRKHGSRALTPDALAKMFDKTATRPVTVRI